MSSTVDSTRISLDPDRAGSAPVNHFGATVQCHPFIPLTRTRSPPVHRLSSPRRTVYCGALQQGHYCSVSLPAHLAAAMDDYAIVLQTPPLNFQHVLVLSSSSLLCCGSHCKPCGSSRYLLSHRSLVSLFSLFLLRGGHRAVFFLVARCRRASCVAGFLQETPSQSKISELYTIFFLLSFSAL